MHPTYFAGNRFSSSRYNKAKKARTITGPVQSRFFVAVICTYKEPTITHA